MKRLVLILTVVCLLIPASVFAQQGAGAFLQGFANGFAMSRGYPPPCPTYQPPAPVYQPPTPPPQYESGAIYHQNGQTDLYSIIHTPFTNSYSGTIYGSNGGITLFQGSRY
jgi:hypothetical protein